MKKSIVTLVLFSFFFNLSALAQENRKPNYVPRPTPAEVPETPKEENPQIVRTPGGGKFDSRLMRLATFATFAGGSRFLLQRFPFLASTPLNTTVKTAKGVHQSLVAQQASRLTPAATGGILKAAMLHTAGPFAIAGVGTQLLMGNHSPRHLAITAASYGSAGLGADLAIGSINRLIVPRLVNAPLPVWAKIAIPAAVLATTWITAGVVGDRLERLGYKKLKRNQETIDGIEPRFKSVFEK